MLPEDIYIPRYSNGEEIRVGDSINGMIVGSISVIYTPGIKEKASVWLYDKGHVLIDCGENGKFRKDVNVWQKANDAIYDLIDEMHETYMDAEAGLIGVGNCAAEIKHLIELAYKVQVALGDIEVEYRDDDIYIVKGD